MPRSYIVSWRARSASLKREEAASADWLLALADLVTVVRGRAVCSPVCACAFGLVWVWVCRTGAGTCAC